MRVVEYAYGILHDSAWFVVAQFIAPLRIWLQHAKLPTTFKRTSDIKLFMHTPHIFQPQRGGMFIENGSTPILSPSGAKCVYCYVAPTELKTFLFLRYYKHIVPTGLKKSAADNFEPLN